MTQLQRSSIWYEKDVQKSNIWIFFQCCVLEGVINLLSRLRKKIHHPYNTLYWRSYKNTMFRYHAVKHRNCFNDYHHKKVTCTPSEDVLFSDTYLYLYNVSGNLLCCLFRSTGLKDHLSVSLCAHYRQGTTRALIGWQLQIFSS